MGTPDTSLDAHDWVKAQGKDVSDRDRILTELVTRGPGTRRDLAKRTGIEAKFVGPRVTELRRDGLARHGEKVRNQDSGREAYLVEATENAKPYLAGTWTPPEDEGVTVKERRAMIVKNVLALAESDGRVWATSQEAKDALDALRENATKLMQEDGRL